jgi:uncharacterized protein YjbI with pentapeptide repeats
MDHDRFDALARRVFTTARRSRRATLAAAFGAALLRHDPGAVLARKTRKRGTASAAAADACYPGTHCTPGKGKNTSGCDFAFSTLFRNKDVRGANLSQSSFAGADLRGADFRGANLSGGCFASANLTGARLGGSVNLHGSIFCNTTMPDGTIDNSGCEGETPCCHLRVQNCPDTKIECYTQDTDGCHQVLVDSFGPVGNCWSFFGGCCPCGHADYDYWEDLCNATFPGGCRACRECTGRCVARQDDVFPPCISFTKKC